MKLDSADKSDTVLFAKNAVSKELGENCAGAGARSPKKSVPQNSVAHARRDFWYNTPVSLRAESRVAERFAERGSLGRDKTEFGKRFARQATQEEYHGNDKDKDSKDEPSVSCNAGAVASALLCHSQGS